MPNSGIFYNKWPREPDNDPKPDPEHVLSKTLKPDNKTIWNQKTRESVKNQKNICTSPFALTNSECTADWPEGSGVDSRLGEHTGRGSARLRVRCTVRMLWLARCFSCRRPEQATLKHNDRKQQKHALNRWHVSVTRQTWQPHLVHITNMLQSCCLWW